MNCDSICVAQRLAIAHTITHTHTPHMRCTERTNGNRTNNISSNSVARDNRFVVRLRSETSKFSGAGAISPLLLAYIREVSSISTGYICWMCVRALAFCVRVLAEWMEVSALVCVKCICVCIVGELKGSTGDLRIEVKKIRIGKNAHNAKYIWLCEANG